jgi:radical SAM protein with 4Fe4S-binding SPASM domain
MACPDCIQHQIGSAELVNRLSSQPGDFPIAGSIELTLRCNVRCRHCYILYPGATSGEMSTDEVKAILDRLAEKGVLFLLLTGGEIFARCDFREIYLHAKRLGFLLTLFTNATLIDEETADFLAEWPPRRIEVTIYGHTEETYEKVTGVRGSFARFRRGVELLKSRNLPLALKTMVMRSNRHEFEAIKKWAEQLGVPFRFDAIVNPRLNGGTDVLQERLDPEDVVRLDGTSEAHRALYQRVLDKAKTHRRSDKAFACGAGIKTFHVDPRGHLHPCMMWRATPYDLKNGSFEGWAEHLAALRETRIPADSECRSCGHHVACNNCAATSALENAGIPGRPVGYYCSINTARERLLDLRRFEINPDSTLRPISVTLSSETGVAG